MSFNPPDAFKAKLLAYLQSKGVLLQAVGSMFHTVLDLSGAAQTLHLLYALKGIRIKKVLLIYMEASSADAGVAIEVGWIACSGAATGRTTDRDGILTHTSEVSKAQYYTKELKIADFNIGAELRAGEILTLFNTGGKTGTGTVYALVLYESLEA